MKKLLATLLVLSSLNALADQCYSVSKSQAKKAVKALSASKVKTGGVLTLCQPCEKYKPEQVRVNQINSLEGNAFSEVLVNGEGIDLAYTYVMVKPSDKRWVNLAKVVGCKHQGTSDYIYEVRKANGSVKFIPSTVEVEW